MLPVLLSEEMAGEIAFVQSLHHDHDGATSRIIEALTEGLVKVAKCGNTLGIGERLQIPAHAKPVTGAAKLTFCAL